MAKIRVHEIAKELGNSSKEMVDILQKMGLEVKNHMSTIEESQANWVRKQLAEKDQPRKRPEQKPAGQPSPKRQSAAKAEKPGPDGAASLPPDRPATRSEGPSDPSQNKRPREEAPPAKGRQQTQPKTQKQQRQQPAAGRPQQRQQPRPGGAVQPPAASRDKSATKSRPQEQRGTAGRSKVPAAQTRAAKTGGTETATRAGRQAASPKGGGRGAARPAQTQPRRDYSRPQRRTKHKRRKEETVVAPPEIISIEPSITVRDLAEQLRRSSAEIMKKLMELGVMASINQPIDFDTAEIVASLYGVKVDRAISAEEKILEEIVDEDGSLQPRPPVVTVMGHVDHGKTSLLDRIRKADVVSGEAGGITQHIGAYQVKVNENRITFIDTPGHEAFTAMRARGANLTDIVILVVAADDGVMPQTVEAINHIRAAEAPFLVAVNKIDKPTANPERVMQQLTEYSIVSEEWGGDTIFVPLSAKTGEGIENLLEMVLLVAEIHDIKANPDRVAEGVVIESKLDKGRGSVATVLVQKGTLKIGDYILSGRSLCRVRAMTDHRGERVETAYPSMPVEITGWSEPPEAGGRVLVCDEKVAKEVISLRVTERKIEEQKQSSRVSLDDFFKHIQDNELKELRLIIKGDVQGSVEALSQSLLRLGTPEVKVTVLHSGVGAVTESDVMLASTSNAIIIGFNVRPDSKARKYAEDEHIDVRLYRVIYEAIAEVKKAMAGLLEPEYREKFLGRAAVRATFKVPNIGLVAGCYVTEGKFLRNAEMRVLRDGVIIYEGKLSSLKRFKDDVKEVAEGFECGMGIKDFNDIKDGDIIEAFIIEEIPREL